MKIKINQLTQQKTIIFTICLFICIPTLAYLVNVSVNFVVSSRFIWDTVIIYGTLLFFMLISLVLSFRNRRHDFIILLAIFIVLFLVSYLVFPENRSYMFPTVTDFNGNSFYRLFLYSLPLYLLLRNIYEYNLLFRYLLYTARIMVLSGWITYLFFAIKGGFELQYMVFAYDILFGVVFCLYDYLRNRNLLSFLLGLSGFLVIIIGGARGPLICLFSFVLLYIMLNAGGNKIRTISIVGLISIGGVYINNNLIMLATNIKTTLFNQFGLQSRTLDLIIQNEFFNQSGRDIIQDTLVQHIWQNPLFGHGMFGDRFLLKGAYAHNFFIEILTQYGIIFGTIIIGVVLILIFRGLIGRQDQLYKDLVLLFLPCGLIKLFLSNSYLLEPYFFLLLAAAVNSLTNKKKYVTIKSKLTINNTQLEERNGVMW